MKGTGRMTTSEGNRARGAILAVITARGGSKRIPGKNIKPFAGRPMIAWPIEAAKASGIFDRIVVSTDSEEIAAVALGLGAEVPFFRPAELSDEFTPTAPVFEHAIRWFMDSGVPVRAACCIYPTAPFLTPGDLRAGHDLVVNAGAPAAISVTTFDFPILRAFRIEGDGSMAFNWPEYALTRSQDLPEFLHDAGQFYWVDAPTFLEARKLMMPGTRPVVLPRTRVQDIDTPEDWEKAEAMAAALLRQPIPAGR